MPVIFKSLWYIDYVTLELLPWLRTSLVRNYMTSSKHPKAFDFIRTHSFSKSTGF